MDYCLEGVVEGRDHQHHAVRVPSHLAAHFFFFLNNYLCNYQCGGLRYGLHFFCFDGPCSSSGSTRTYTEHSTAQHAPLGRHEPRGGFGRLRGHPAFQVPQCVRDLRLDARHLQMYIFVIVGAGRVCVRERQHMDTHTHTYTHTHMYVHTPIQICGGTSVRSASCSGLCKSSCMAANISLPYACVCV